MTFLEENNTANETSTETSNPNPANDSQVVNEGETSNEASGDTDGETKGTEVDDTDGLNDQRGKKDKPKREIRIADVTFYVGDELVTKREARLYRKKSFDNMWFADRMEIEKFDIQTVQSCEVIERGEDPLFETNKAGVEMAREDFQVILSMVHGTDEWGQPMISRVSGFYTLECPKSMYNKVREIVVNDFLRRKEDYGFAPLKTIQVVTATTYKVDPSLPQDVEGFVATTKMRSKNDVAYAMDTRYFVLGDVLPKRYQ